MFHQDLIGWIAALVMLSSFFFKDNYLKLAQLVGCGLWAGYGFIIHSKPMIIANFLMIFSIILSFIIMKKKTTP